MFLCFVRGLDITYYFFYVTGKKASLEGETAKEIGQLMKTIGQVLESKPEVNKKPIPLDRILKKIEEEWLSYGKNLGLRVAAIDDKETRDNIRHEIEQAIYPEQAGT